MIFQVKSFHAFPKRHDIDENPDTPDKYSDSGEIFISGPCPPSGGVGMPNTLEELFSRDCTSLPRAVDSIGCQTAPLSALIDSRPPDPAFEMELPRS